MNFSYKKKSIQTTLITVCAFINIFSSNYSQAKEPLNLSDYSFNKPTSSSLKLESIELETRNDQVFHGIGRIGNLDDQGHTFGFTTKAELKSKYLKQVLKYSQDLYATRLAYFSGLEQNYETNYTKQNIELQTEADFDFKVNPIFALGKETIEFKPSIASKIRETYHSALGVYNYKAKYEKDLYQDFSINSYYIGIGSSYDLDVDPFKISLDLRYDHHKISEQSNFNSNFYIDYFDRLFISSGITKYLNKVNENTIYRTENNKTSDFDFYFQLGLKQEFNLNTYISTCIGLESDRYSLLRHKNSYTEPSFKFSIGYKF